MRIATSALVRGAWTEQFNQGWRFSRCKVGLWPLLLQLGVALLLLWRMRPAPAPVALALPLAVAALQAGLGGFTLGLLRGREEVYGKAVLRVLHASPVAGASILAGLALAGLPLRLVGSLLTGLVVGLLFPAGSPWWSLPLLGLAALLSSQVGYGAALLAVVGWVRLHPRSLALLWAFALALAFGLASILLLLLLVGGPVTALLPLTRSVLPWLAGFLGPLLGLPGLLFALWVALRPERAGEWYREAYLQAQELADGRSQVRPSRWPRVLPGPAGALQARLWRELWLNWFTWVRLGLALLALGFFAWAPGQTAVVVERSPFFLLILGLTAAIGAFAEVAVTVGSSDGPNIGLAMVAGLRAGQVLRAKWLAVLPLTLLAALCTGVLALRFGQPALLYSLVAGLLALIFSLCAVGGGLCDLDPAAEVTEREVPDLIRALLEQIPRKPGGMVGMVLGILCAAGAGWLSQRLPDHQLPVALGAALVAHLALLPGYLHLRRLGL